MYTLTFGELVSLHMHTLAVEDYLLDATITYDWDQDHFSASSLAQAMAEVRRLREKLRGHLLPYQALGIEEYREPLTNSPSAGVSPAVAPEDLVE